MAIIPADVARTAETTDTVNRLSLPALYIVTTYLNPITRVDTPLPLHAWLLASVPPGNGARQGQTSDALGHSILRPQKEDHTADHEWELGWWPWLAPGQPMPYAGNNEAWLDLETNQWVPSAQIGAIEKRKLLRLESWTTTQKVLTGGFFESFNDHFRDTGKLLSKDLARVRLAHGSHARAFHVKVDFQWFRSHVHFLFYDFTAKATKPVPPGLVLRAEDREGNLVGAGTAIKDDGTIFVLHHRTKEQSDELHYHFQTPKEYTLVDLTKTPPSVEFKPPQLTPPTPPPKPATRYLLPVEWHSKGWQFLPFPRTDWDAEPGKRTENTDAVPLMFHLDDMLLVDDDRDPVELEEETDVTVFNQLLKLRNPRSDRPMVTGPPVSINYFAAELYVVVEGTDITELTRAVDNDGNLYDLREHRREGTANDTVGLGMRIAIHDDHPSESYSMGNKLLTIFACYELHLFDTVIDDFIYPARDGSAVKCRLFHLMPYQSGWIDAEDPTALPAMYATFETCSAVWSPGHPAFTTNGFKRYALVPEETGPVDGGPLVLLRHFSTARKDDAMGILTFELNPEPFKRASYEWPAKVLHLSQKKVVPDANPMTDPDGMTALHYTYAHELGHALGLPDEYEETHGFVQPEGWPKEDILRLPEFSQDDPFFPFCCDLRGMMRSDYLPRLRYIWHHGRSMNDIEALAGAVGNAKLIPEHANFFGQRLSYKLPFLPDSVMSGQADANPWEIVGQDDLEGGFARLGLYRLGDDEAAAGGILYGNSPWAPMVQHFDGALMVRVRFRFTAGDGVLMGDVATAAIVFDAFAVEQRGAMSRQMMRFAIGTAGAAWLRNIAIVFEPWYRLGSSPLPLADVHVEILPPGTVVPDPLLLPPDERPGTLSMTPAMCDYALWRHALGIPTTNPANPGVRIAGPPTGAELAASKLIAFVDDLLGDAPSPARTVNQILP